MAWSHHHDNQCTKTQQASKKWKKKVFRKVQAKLQVQARADKIAAAAVAADMRASSMTSAGMGNASGGDGKMTETHTGLYIYTYAMLTTVYAQSYCLHGL